MPVLIPALSRHECLRHVLAQVNFPNYPKSPADIRRSEAWDFQKAMQPREA
jgi:hypothetical protein